jgi:hypothetical protein
MLDRRRYTMGDLDALGLIAQLGSAAITTGGNVASSFIVADATHYSARQAVKAQVLSDIAQANRELQAQRASQANLATVTSAGTSVVPWIFAGFVAFLLLGRKK